MPLLVLRRGLCERPHQQHELKRMLKIGSLNMPDIITEYPIFLQLTNLEWKKLLQPDKYNIQSSAVCGFW